MSEPGRSSVAEQAVDGLPARILAPDPGTFEPLLASTSDPEA